MENRYCLKCEANLDSQSKWDYECNDKFGCLERRVSRLEHEVIEPYDPGSMVEKECKCCDNSMCNKDIGTYRG